MNKKIALLSYRCGNVGHLMMAIGMEEIIKKIFGKEVNIIHFEQHRPFSIHPKYHPLRIVNNLFKNYFSGRFSFWGRFKNIKNFLNQENVSRFFWKQTIDLSSFDLAISCGGPIINKTAYNSPEIRLIYHYLMGAFNFHNIPVLDLAVGSAYPLENIPQKLEEEEEIKFYKRIIFYTKGSSARDKLAQILLRQLGREAPLIPCPAIASSLNLEVDNLKNNNYKDNEKFVAINFLPKGANTDWGQKVNEENWFTTVKNLIYRLKKRHKILFLCHHPAEKKLAKKLDNSLPIHLPSNWEEYGNITKKIKAGLVCRIHAGIGLASFGIPSIVVGTDTRLWTVDLIGLKNFYVKNTNVDILEESLEEIIKNNKEEREKLNEVKKTTINLYSDFIIKFIKK